MEAGAGNGKDSREVGREKEWGPQVGEAPADPTFASTKWLRFIVIGSLGGTCKAR